MPPPRPATATRPEPIFVGGCDRSGTTLLGAMLGADPATLCVPEAQFVVECHRAVARGEVAADPAALYRWMAGRWRFRYWGIDPEPLGIDTLADAALGTPTLATPALAMTVRWLVARYGARVDKPSPRRWVDHTPHNLRRAHTLLELFPEARFVHIVRDGRAVAASILPLDWGPNDIAAAARWWVERVAYGLALESTLPADRIVRVRYEELVAEPAATLEQLTAVLGIDYVPAMARGGGFRVPRYTRAQHRLVPEPPDPSRAEAWRTQLTPRQVEIFEFLTGDFLLSLGYTPVVGPAARPPTRAERYASDLREQLYLKLVNPLRKRLRRVEP